MQGCISLMQANESTLIASKGDWNSPKRSKKHNLQLRAILSHPPFSTYITVPFPKQYITSFNKCILQLGTSFTSVNTLRTWRHTKLLAKNKIYKHTYFLCCWETVRLLSYCMLSFNIATSFIRKFQRLHGSWGITRVTKRLIRS